MAQEGKPRAKTGHNTETSSTSEHKPYKWHELQFKLRALGAFSYLKVTEETALISNSIRLHLGHLDAVEK